MLAHLSRPTLRTAARALHSTPSRLAPGLAAKAGGQSVGEDAADTARKNTAVPVFVAAGAGIAGCVCLCRVAGASEVEYCRGGGELAADGLLRCGRPVGAGTSSTRRWCVPVSSLSRSCARFSSCASAPSRRGIVAQSQDCVADTTSSTCSTQSSRQQNHEEKKDAKHDQAKENVVRPYPPRHCPLSHHRRRRCGGGNSMQSMLN